MRGHASIPEGDDRPASVAEATRPIREYEEARQLLDEALEAIEKARPEAWMLEESERDREHGFAVDRLIQTARGNAAEALRNLKAAQQLVLRRRLRTARPVGNDGRRATR
ncbi:MAG: hypothetical protein OXG72_12890 [Acidobacteria bacterium]|nr:hypothetical protein [Acidobacteriota bacterium]